MEASIGRFGPYVKHDTSFKSIPKSESVYDINLERAVQLLSQPKTQRGDGGRSLGDHPIDQKPVVVMEGRYGAYIKHGNVNLTIPAEYDPATLTLDDAVDLLAEKAAKELVKSGSTASPTPLAQQGPSGMRAGNTGRSRGNRPGGSAGHAGKLVAGNGAGGARRAHGGRGQAAGGGQQGAGRATGGAPTKTANGQPRQPARKTSAPRRAPKGPRTRKPG